MNKEQPKESLDELIRDATSVVPIPKSELRSRVQTLIKEALTCKKVVEGNAVCSCKLDCHIHDWRQKDEINKMVKNIGMLRQWLNEERITDPKKMVTNEEIEYWLGLGDNLKKK